MKRARPWSEAKGRETRAVVRLVVVESFAAVLAADATYDESRREGAAAMAAEILRRLGLAPIGREVVAGAVRDLVRKGGT